MSTAGVTVWRARYASGFLMTCGSPLRCPIQFSRKFRNNVAMPNSVLLALKRVTGHPRAASSVLTALM